MTSRAHLCRAALALVLLLFSLTACGGDNTAATPSADATQSTGVPAKLDTGAGTQVAQVVNDTPTPTVEAYDAAPALPTSTVLPIQALPAARGVTPVSRSSTPKPIRAAVTPVPGTVPKNYCYYSGLDINTPGFVGDEGGLVTELLFTNMNSSACLLKGFPIAVQILDGNNRVLAFGQINDPNYYPDITIDPFNVLRSQRTGVALVDWQNWCGPGIQLPMKMRFTLPGNAASHTQVITNGLSRTPFDKPPTRNTCDDDPASKLYVGPLVVPGTSS